MIWLIENNLIRQIASAEIFNSYRFNWNDIQTISFNEKNIYDEYELMRINNSPDIFIFYATLGAYQNCKQKIPSMEIFNANNFHSDQIVTMNQLEFDNYQQIEDLR